MEGFVDGIVKCGVTNSVFNVAKGALDLVTKGLRTDERKAMRQAACKGLGTELRKACEGIAICVVRGSRKQETNNEGRFERLCEKLAGVL